MTIMTLPAYGLRQGPVEDCGQVHGEGNNSLSRDYPEIKKG